MQPARKPEHESSADDFSDLDYVPFSAAAKAARLDFLDAKNRFTYAASIRRALTDYPDKRALFNLITRYWLKHRPAGRNRRSSLLNPTWKDWAFERLGQYGWEIVVAVVVITADVCDDRGPSCGLADGVLRRFTLTGSNAKRPTGQTRPPSNVKPLYPRSGPSAPRSRPIPPGPANHVPKIESAPTPAHGRTTDGTPMAVSDILKAAGLDHFWKPTSKDDAAPPPEAE